MSILDRELPRAAWVGAVVPSVGLVGLGVFALLYTYRADWYFGFLGILIGKPYRFPFLDAQFVMGSVDCWRRGIDVYATNPCDELIRQFNYSPIWLRLRFLPTDKRWTNVVGLTIDGMFLVSLAWLPRPRRVGDLGLIVLATFSSITVFGLERGNVDLLIFALAVATGVSLEHALPWRIIAYVAAVLAGLLKFYPFVLLLLMLRERFARFLVLALLATLVMAAFVWQYHDEIPRATANIIGEGYFGETFGARQLPNAVTLVLLNVPHPIGWGNVLRPAPYSELFPALLVLFLAVAILLAARLAAAADFAAALVGLTERERNFLVIGAALITGCFFAGTSIGYRAMHLVFALPGVLVVARIGAGRGTRAVFRLAGYSIFFILWWETLRFIGKQVGRPAWALRVADAAWIIHELAWWLVATVFLAVLFRFVVESPVCRAVIGGLRRLRVGTVAC